MGHRGIKLAIDELHIEEASLPLDNLDENITCRDALIDESGALVKWPAADVIIGNPPFLGAKNVHVSIVNWVKLPSPEADAEGLVASIDPKRLAKAMADKLLIPAERKLWQKVEPSLPLFDKDDGKRRRTSTPGKRSSPRKDKSYELIDHGCPYINSALSDKADVSAARALGCNKEPQRCFQGIVTGYSGFVVSLNQRREWLKADAALASVVRPYLIGRDLVTGTGQPTRAVIDFGASGQFEARKYRQPWDHLSRKVLPKVIEKAKEAEGGSMEDARVEHVERWWQFWNVRVRMRAAFEALTRYIGVSRTTKRPIFCFLSTEICPDSKIQTFALDDDFSFGVVSSNAHWVWLSHKGARLKTADDRAYSSRSVWDTFPWPQLPTAKQIDVVAEAGRDIRRVREGALTKISGGLRAVYRTLELPGKNPLKDAHAALNKAVLDAYGFDPKDDLLRQILDLNFQVAARIDRGADVTAPGVPPSYPDPKRLVTNDCIRP